MDRQVIPAIDVIAIQGTIEQPIVHNSFYVFYSVCMLHCQYYCITPTVCFASLGPESVQFRILPNVGPHAPFGLVYTCY